MVAISQDQTNGKINWRSSILPMAAIFEDLMKGKINWRSSILPMVAISEDLTNGNNQLAEQHPTNGGNI